MVAANEDHAYLFLSLLQSRVGASMMRRIPGGEAGSLLQRSAPELAREMGLGEKATRALAELAEGFDAAAMLERLERKGFRAVTYADQGYPTRLKLAPDPPPALFVGGELGEGVSVAIVGSRRASRPGLETAEVLGRALAARGACVVNGLAAGVDAAAHEGALAVGGKTVGVLGCGIDVTYPRKYKPPWGEVPRLCDRRKRGSAVGLGCPPRVCNRGPCGGSSPGTSPRGGSRKFSDQGTSKPGPYGGCADAPALSILAGL